MLSRLKIAFRDMHLSFILKTSVLYVFDPKALHHIVVKDQYIFEETPIFLKLS